MAVKTSDLVQNTGDLKRLEEETAAALAEMRKMETQAGKLEAKMQKLNTATAAQRIQVEGTAKQAAELERRYKTYNESVTKAAINIAKLKLEQREQNKANRTAVELTRAAAGSYNQIKARLDVVTRSLRAMSKQERTTTESGKRLTRQSQLLTAELRSLRVEAGTNTGAMGRLARGFHSFTQAVKSAFIVGGLSAVLLTITRFIGSAINVFSDFQRQVSLLGATSGATRVELQELEADARRLGETTEFTATEVAKLQTIFARGGFSPREIVDATEATLNLALATESSLAEAALVVADNIRAYGLEASQAGKFTDTLTAALNSSNITLENYKEASKELAPVAKILQISAEDSAAAIGILGDNGIKGTAATTTLASGLLKLSDESKKYAKAAKEAGIEVFNQNGQFVGLGKLLENIEGATKDLTDQEKLATLGRIVGIQSARSFAVLLNSTKEVITDTGREVKTGGEALSAYSDQLDRAGGSAAFAASLIGDNLTGDMKELASATEGAKINFISFFNDGIRNVVQGLTDFVGKVNEFLSIPLSKKLEDEQSALNGLVGALINVNDNVEDVNLRNEVRSKLITEIQTKYPDFIKNIDLETASTGELTKALSQANDAFTQKIILQRQEEELNEIFQKRATLVEDLIRLQKEQAEGTTRLRQNVLGGGIGDTTVEDDIARTQRIISRLDNQAAEVTARRSKELQFINGLLSDQKTVIEDVVEEAEKVSGSGKETADKFKAAAGSITFLKAELSKLNEQLQGSTIGQQEGLLVKILGAEKALAAAEDALVQIRRRIDQQKGFQIVEPLDSEPFDQLVVLGQKARSESLSIAFDQYQELERSRFNITKHSEEEITQFRLQQEKARLEETLRLNLVAGGAQVEIVKNQIAALSRQLKEGADPETESQSIFDLLGIDLSEGQLAAAGAAFSFVKSQLNDAAKVRKQIADQRVEEAKESVAAAQRNLQIELADEQNRSTRRIQVREKELSQAARLQARAQREQDKAARAERRAASIQQTQGLITASAKIWSQFGFPLAIPFIATMFGSFIAAKVRANQLARRDAKHGFTEKIATHDSHASGNDKPMWTNNQGEQIFAEKGEVSTIFPKKTVKKYGPKLNDIIGSLFSLNFQEKFLAPATTNQAANISFSSERFDDSRLVESVNRLASGKREIRKGENGAIIDTWGFNQRISK